MPKKNSNISATNKLSSSETDNTSVKKITPAKKDSLDAKLTELTETNRRLKRKIFDLYTIFEISRNFNAVHNYLSLLDSFIFTCLGQVGSIKGSIFLKPDGQGKAFYCVKAKGSGKSPEAEQHFNIDSKLLKYLKRLNRPVPIEDPLGEISTKKEKEILNIYPNGILLPLMFQTRLSGIFIMSEKMSGSSFLPVDIEFLSVLGGQISVAIENARLYEAEIMATRQLREAQQQLLQSERLAALGEMSARVAHEVNNPLGIIKNYLALISRSEKSTESGKSVSKNDESKEYIKIVGQEIDRIAQIVRQLLEFHRPVEIELKPIDIEQVVEDVLRFMERPLKSDKVELTREFLGTAPMILGELQSLKQVFLNLLINARDAMEGGGKLTVQSRTDNDKYIIRFIDSGPGILPQLIPRIFEPFFSTKEPGKGTGLGLSVCYGIMKHHKGSITFSNVESGGCFELTMPLYKDTETNDNN